MSLIRPAVVVALARWREVLTGAGVAVLGVWVFSLGGLFFQGLGAIVAATGGALGIIGLRRMRFAGHGGALGLVEVTEGQITYLAARGGGFVALGEMTRLRLVQDDDGQRHWLVSQRGRGDLAIPVDVVGAEDLFDAFVSLPAADPRRMLTALDNGAAQGPVTIWQPPVHVALT